MQKSLKDFSNYLNQGFEKAQKSHHSILIPNLSKINLHLLSILQKEGFIDSWQISKVDSPNAKFQHPAIAVNFRKAPQGRHFKITSLLETHVQQHFNVKELRVYNQFRGLDLLILTTNRGLLTHRQALKYCIGGFLVCRLQVR